MPIALQLHLTMMGKNSKFGVDTFNTFELWATFKFLHAAINNDDIPAITIALLFLWKKQANHPHPLTQKNGLN